MPSTEGAQNLRRIVHDCRGPLNAIGLGVRALAHNPALKGSEERILESIRANADRLANIVTQLLDEPAPDAGETITAETASLTASGAGTISVLLVEDNPDDAARLQREFAMAGEFAITRVDRLDAALDRLRSTTFDVVLLDLFLPDSEGLDTLRRVQEQEQRAAIVVLTASSDRTTALEAVRSGAQDYLVKGFVDSTTLARAMVYAVERKHTLADRERLIAQLVEALATVKRLSGLLPICASCKRIRDENGAWQPIEEYVHAHSEADFSHGICDQCLASLYRTV